MGNQILLDPKLTAVYDTSIKGLSSNFLESRKSDFIAIKLMCKNRSLSLFMLVLMFLEKTFSKFLLPRYETRETVLRLLDGGCKLNDQ